MAPPDSFRDKSPFGYSDQPTGRGNESGENIFNPNGNAKSMKKNKNQYQY